ncbi:PCMD domain-containing protein [Flammeovirga agarivorans]|uniref:Putative carbohydrate metabolism domain-containing protein n=1 Tax=Flammeovirga agarivorans TaxID=2726742 RepID=A0A7X8SPA9_9BACT|nr:PCMD domain-containing protein [Flammeovirga agarivorans]NLR93906.1 hypothetical protein [Flammeovirga agarivorans]
MKNIYKFIILLSLLFTSCIKNDVPYPYIFGEILSFQLEVQEGGAMISSDEQRIEVLVPFGTDITNLEIVDLTFTEDATITPSFNEVKDFSEEVRFTVSTYQDYEWTVHVIEADFNVNITSFSIEGQIAAEIDNMNRIVKVKIPFYLDKENLFIETFSYSPADAIVFPLPQDTHDFSEDVIFSFEGIEWTIQVDYDNDEERIGDQILYSDFNTWYYGGRKEDESNANRKFYLPGSTFDATPWRTGDVGAADLIIPTGVQTVFPYPSIEEYEYTILRTTSMLGVIAAGSLYTGEIQGSGLTNVITDFGIPFNDKPKSFTTSIQYLPKRFDQGMDACDVYVLLQVREGSGEDEKRYRLATGWYRTDTSMNEFQEISIPLLYGNHNDLAPYMMPSTNNDRMPEHGFAEVSKSPTHIIVVYSSSYDGANFNGGVGSELRVKEFQLNY